MAYLVSRHPSDGLQRSKADHKMMQFDWDDVAHRRVVNVLGKEGQTLSDGAANWEAVAICVEGRSVCLSVDSDTDQIEATLSKTPPEGSWEPIPSFSFAVGQRLGWCWEGIKSQGYKDSLTLAFGDVPSSALQPRCTFVAEATSLTCFDLAPRMA